MKIALMHDKEKIRRCLRLVLSLRLPHTHSKRNIPKANIAANVLHPTMPIPSFSM